MSDERFDRIDQTLDRILGVLQDHGRQLDELNSGQAEIRADLRQIRVAVDSLQEGFAEHLGWHLGQAR